MNFEKSLRKNKMEKKDIDNFKISIFQWELFKLKQKYEEDIIMLFEKNNDILSKKEKKYLKEIIKKNERKAIIGGIVKLK